MPAAATASETDDAGLSARGRSARAAARGGGSGRFFSLAAEPLEVLLSETERLVFPDKPLVTPALAANEGGARRSARVEAGRHVSPRGAHAGARKSRGGASKDGRGCVPARSNAKRGIGRVADAAGAEASREATARSAPLDTARDIVRRHIIVCTRVAQSFARGRNRIRRAFGRSFSDFLETAESASSPSRPPARHTESRARWTRIAANSRAEGNGEIPVKPRSRAARSNCAEDDSSPWWRRVS